MIHAVIVFAATLLLAVFLSEYAERSVLSTAVLFLAVGFLSGRGIVGFITFPTESPILVTITELALFSVLFTDGMKMPLATLRTVWRLPGRALLFGMPLTSVGLALFAHYLVGLTWTEAFLVGAVLMPTDPVFASAIVGRREIPSRLRNLLNVESGVNDGLALPVVVVLLAVMGREELDVASLVQEVIFGIALGIGVAYGATRLAEGRYLEPSAMYEPLHVFSIGLLIFGVAKWFGVNLYLAAFGAGVTVTTVGEQARLNFEGFGELVAELFKLLAILLFGAVITKSFFRDLGLFDYLFALLAVAVVRPVAVWLALLGSDLSSEEKLVAGWFGPKGFASVLYGLLVLKSGLAHAELLFHLIAIVVVGSMIAHSSTDVLIAQQFQQQQEDSAPQQ
ncbi:MAG: cation:proton antiporter [Caldilineaceae bacterium]